MKTVLLLTLLTTVACAGTHEVSCPSARDRALAELQILYPDEVLHCEEVTPVETRCNGFDIIWKQDGTADVAYDVRHYPSAHFADISCSDDCSEACYVFRGQAH